MADEPLKGMPVVTADAVAADETKPQSQFEQFRQLLLQLPNDICKSRESEPAMSEHITKYAYATLREMFETKVSELLQDPTFHQFGKTVDELAAKKMMLKTSNDDNLARPLHNMQSVKEIAEAKESIALGKKVTLNNTKVEELIMEIEKKRERIKNIQNKLDKL